MRSSTANVGIRKPVLEIQKNTDKIEEKLNESALLDNSVILAQSESVK